MSQKFIKGLWSDARPVKQPPGTYPFAKNGIQYFNTGSVSNEIGFRQADFNTPGMIIGIVETDTYPIIFSVAGNGRSFIGFHNIDLDTYEGIIDDDDFDEDQKLNFDPNHYITGEAQRNYLNQIVVAFTDKFQKPWILNTADPDAIEGNEDMLLFLQSTAPSMTVTVDGGGALLKGAYYVSIKYLK